MSVCSSGHCVWLSPMLVLLLILKASLYHQIKLEYTVLLGLTLLFGFAPLLRKNDYRQTMNATDTRLESTSKGFLGRQIAKERGKLLLAYPSYHTVSRPPAVC